MRDKLLTYALVASIGVHLVVLGLVGKTSAAKPIEVEQLKIVRVDLVKTPDDIAVQPDKSQPSKPTIEEQSPPEAPYVPPPQRMVTDTHPPKPKVPPKPVNTQPPVNPGPVRTATNQAGDPGGALSGITAPNGEDLGQTSNGNTSVGWVPGPDHGKGSGSGSGQGTGHPDPIIDAHPGPSVTPGSGTNVTPPPPTPRMVTITVCSVSGLLPGPYCDKTEKKTFKEGSEPALKCNICKAPEPTHISTLADRVEPELIKDIKPVIPDIDEYGEYVIKVHYTVNKDGSVSDVEVTQSSGIKAIDKAVVTAASKLRYNPAVQNGEPRSVKIKRTYKVNI